MEAGDRVGEPSRAGAATDAELIAASLRDGREFAPIFDRHYDAIAAFLRRRLEPATADELASETFVQAFAGRADFDLGRDSAAPWLYGIAANLMRRHRRSEARRLRAYARAAEPGSQPAHTDHVDARLDAGASARALAHALAALPPRRRDALLLHAWTELSYEEIATALDVPVGTVRSRIHRARAQLRELISRGGEEGARATTLASEASQEDRR